VHRDGEVSVLNALGDIAGIDLERDGSACRNRARRRKQQERT